MRALISLVEGEGDQDALPTLLTNILLVLTVSVAWVGPSS